MSILYKESNEEGAMELFEKKEFYDIDTFSSHPNLMDFEFAERILYGRVDQFYQAIVPKDYILELKRIPSDSNTSQTTYALNFVVDVFEKLRKQFNKKQMRGEISKSEDFLSNITAYKGYVSPIDAYNKHVDTYLQAFEAIVRDKDIRFLNFEKFIRMLMPFLKKTTRKRPFTLPAFMKSTYCPMNVSGLVIEVADIKCDNDLEKIKNFYESKNWDFYLTTCNNMGFMVDKNNPWRLVADIASAEMQQHAALYGIPNVYQMLNVAYRKAHKGYLDTFKVIMYNMYNKLKTERFTTLTTTQQNGSQIVVRETVNYSYQDFTTQYDDAYFLNLYCMMRFSEDEAVYTKEEQRKIIDNVIQLSNTSIDRAMDAFETILSKTVDYRGSLSYINNTLK